MAETISREERATLALEKIADLLEQDFKFRQQAAQEQAELVQRLTSPQPVPVPIGGQRRARRT